MAPSGRRIACGDIGGARDAVGRAEGAAQHGVGVHDRDQARGFGGVDPPRLGQPDAVPHFHVATEVLDLLGQSEDEQVAEPPEVGRVASLFLERLEHANRPALQTHIGLHRELLAHASGALAGRLRAERFPLEEKDVDLTAGQLVGESAAHDAAARDDYVSAFHL